MKFWDRVEKCKHENLTDYFETFRCGTPYCGGQEIHCADCGVYIDSCACTSWNGYSGWPRKRHLKEMQKKKR
jgi:hypothetical protein